MTHLISKRAAIFWGAACLFAAALPAFGVAQSLNRDARGPIVGADYDTIIERGWIKIGVYKDNAPYSFIRDGELVGIDIDLGRLIAADLGVEPRFRAVGADENVDDDLRNNVWKGHYLGGGVVNVMMRVPYNRELDIRNELVVLGGQYANERIGIAWSLDAFPDYPDDPPTLPVFRFEDIGVEIDTLADFYLATIYGGQVAPHLKHYPLIDDAMAALATGEITAVMGPAAQLEYGASLAPDAPIKVAAPRFMGLSHGEWTIGLAVRHNYRQLGYAVADTTWAASQDGRLEAIYAAYGATYRPPEW